MPIDVENTTKYRNILALFRKNEIIGTEIQPIIKSEIFRIGKNNFSGIKRAMFYDLFISGARVSEIINSTNAERDIVEDENGVEYYQLDLVNLKNKLKPRKRIIGYFSDKIEKEMIEFILNELKIYNLYDKPYQIPYPQKNKRLSITKEFSKIKIPIGIQTKEGIKYFPDVSLFPHLLRHSRAYNLVNQYHYDALELTSFMGWTDSRPAMIYCHANTDTFKAKGKFSK